MKGTIKTAGPCGNLIFLFVPRVIIIDEPKEIKANYIKLYKKV